MQHHADLPAQLRRVVLESNPVPVVPLALQNLWGSYFSRAGGSAMSKPFRRGWFGRVGLVAGDALAPTA